MKTRKFMALIVLSVLIYQPLITLAQTTHEVTVGNNFFSPANLTIQAGDTVRWTNPADGGPPHNVDGNGFASTTAESFVFTQVFTQAGVENYLCTVHGSSMSGTITVQGGGTQVDLILDEIGVNNNITYQPGDPIAIDTEVRNVGSAASAAYTVNYYLSTDSSITTGDTLLGSSNRPGLGAGNDANFTGNVNLPGGLAGGSYFVGGIIDINDANNGNNTNLEDEPISVQGGQQVVDLALQNVNVANGNYQQGASITVQRTVSNLGNQTSGTASISFYASTDNTISGADTLLGSQNVPALAPGAMNTTAFQGTVPGNLAPGNYFIGGIITTADANGGNNSGFDATTIAVTQSGGFALNPGHNGNWWAGPSRNGEGLQVEISDNNDGGLVLVATMYSYNPQGNPIFLLALGQVVDGEADVIVYIYEGPTWGDGFDPANLVETEWGTGHFSSTGCDLIQMVLTPNGTFQGMGYTALSYDLIRLTTPAVPCPAP
jgi:plastocyanin